MKIKSIIFNNVGLKITALFLAFFVWAMITGKERSYTERTIDVNVEYFNISPNIDVRNVRPEKVRLRIRGTSKQFERVTPEDFKVRIDLRGVTEGTRLNYFTEDYLQYPEGMNPFSIHPRMIEINVKQFMARDVPIRVRYKGDLQPGVLLKERVLRPEKVRIFGYKSEIAAIDNVEASEWIDLSKLRQNTVIRLPLKKDKDILKFEDTDTVEVHIIIENKNK